MSDRSAIEWTEATWNPTTGCDRVSEGCDNGYALTLTNNKPSAAHPSAITPRTRRSPRSSNRDSLCHNALSLGRILPFGRTACSHIGQEDSEQVRGILRPDGPELLDDLAGPAAGCGRTGWRHCRVAGSGRGLSRRSGR